MCATCNGTRVEVHEVSQPWGDAEKEHPCPDCAVCVKCNGLLIKGWPGKRCDCV